MPSTPLVGRLISGHYRVDACIGEGGVSLVYRGQDLTRGRPVAIKVLPRAAASVEELAQRFKREIAAAQRIDHPSVPAIYDSGTLDDGTMFMIMELLDGRLLSQIIEAGALERRRALILARQILTSLDAAHRIGIVHRDVKPKNVMVVSVGGLETVKLFDFGIASNDRAAIKLTLPGSAFGTPGYISPEMARGERVDARADLYSVGVTLYEMVTGHLPFRTDDELALIRAHIHEPPPAPRSIDPAIPPALDDLIMRAMRKSADERFPSAQAMIDAIDRLLSPPKRERVWPWIALAGAAVAALAFGAWRLLAK
ncbi:MAG TPA: serine/threonine-protein kinase [Polyangia bacterium]|nr:serine/threonine-protein kinase [Polyangia bacterium]